MNNDLILEVANLNVVFNKQSILKNINFKVKKGETVAIIGPNGAGKTVLLKALLNLLPYRGSVNWKKGVKIGYVPQKFNISVDMPLTTREFFKLKEDNDHKINEILQLLNYSKDKSNQNQLKESILERKVGVLSGGEMQKMMIAWALLKDPEILLFDEPTAGVDISSEETIYSILKNLQEKRNLSIILISHELQVVFRYATKVICLNKKQLCFGAPKKVMKEGKLEEVFGKEVAFYEHGEHTH